MDNVEWRSSSFSDGLQCVEVADGGDHVSMRDSKDRNGPTLKIGKGALAAFVQGAKAGEFDDLG